MLNTIEQLNKEARLLNSQREQMIGKREMAERAYKDAVTEYYNMYGVQITTQNIDMEYAKVEQEVKENIEKLKSSIKSIKSGEYKTKQEVVDVVISDTVVKPIEIVKPEETVKEVEVDLSVNQANLGGSDFALDTKSVVTKVEESKKEGTVIKPNIDEGFDVSQTQWGSNNVNSKFEDILGGSEFSL